MTTLSLKLSTDLFQSLQAVAQQLHTSQSDVARQALQRFISQTQQQNNDSLLAQMDDLVGCFVGAPADLSTNPAHMAEFGKH